MPLLRPTHLLQESDMPLTCPSLAFLPSHPSSCRGWGWLLSPSSIRQGMEGRNPQGGKGSHGKKSTLASLGKELQLFLWLQAPTLSPLCTCLDELCNQLLLHADVYCQVPDFLLRSHQSPF